MVVDARLRTSDPAVSAIGDCARYPAPGDAFVGGTVRLESVQNAIDHARYLSAGLSGALVADRATPWFWSRQAGCKLQIAGLATGHDLTVVRAGDTNRGFSVFCYRAENLVAVE